MTVNEKVLWEVRGQAIGEEHLTPSSHPHLSLEHNSQQKCYLVPKWHVGVINERR